MTAAESLANAIEDIAVARNLTTNWALRKRLDDAVVNITRALTKLENDQ